MFLLSRVFAYQDKHGGWEMRTITLNILLVWCLVTLAITIISWIKDFHNIIITFIFLIGYMLIVDLDFIYSIKDSAKAQKENSIKFKVKGGKEVEFKARR